MISALGSRELRAVALAMSMVGRDVRSAINKETRVTMNPVWRDEVTARAHSTRDRAVIAKGARVAAGNPPQVIAGSSTRPLSGGLVPAAQWAAVEFGGFRSKVTTYTGRSPKGKSYSITRHASRQLPSFVKTGRIAYPALKAVGPRLASLWVQTVVRMMYRASEGRQP